MREIKIQTESIKLGQFLKFVGAVSMGAEVKVFLEKNVVKVNLEPEKQRGKRLYKGDLVEINGEKYVLEVEQCE